MFCTVLRQEHLRDLISRKFAGVPITSGSIWASYSLCALWFFVCRPRRPSWPLHELRVFTYEVWKETNH